jgi:hypothetical protein
MTVFWLSPEYWKLAEEQQNIKVISVDDYTNL